MQEPATGETGTGPHPAARPTGAPRRPETPEEQFERGSELARQVVERNRRPLPPLLLEGLFSVVHLWVQLCSVPVLFRVCFGWLPRALQVFWFFVVVAFIASLGLAILRPLRCMALPDEEKPYLLRWLRAETWIVESLGLALLFGASFPGLWTADSTEVHAFQAMAIVAGTVLVAWAVRLRCRDMRRATGLCRADFSGGLYWPAILNSYWLVAGLLKLGLWG
jgi:hypothetical protein